MSGTTHETAIEAPADLPVIRTTREFDAPPERVFRAHTDPELLTRWFGPSGTTTTFEHWDCRTGGTYRYTHASDGMAFTSFGCFHAVDGPTSIVQTVAMVGMGDGVVLERYRFEPLLAGGTQLTVTTLAEDFATRDQIVASGMEHGVREGFERLDALLTDGAGA